MDDDKLYRLLFKDIRIDQHGDGVSQLPRFAKLLRWCSSLGCVIQSCDETITTPFHSYCVTRPSLFISAVLSADWRSGRPCTNLTDVPYCGNTLVAIAMREPTVWIGDTPRCNRLRVAGIAVPLESVEALGLGEHFEDM